MNIMVVYRPRGSVAFTHRFRVAARDWRSFYRHCRRLRTTAEHARVTASGALVSVLA